MNCECCKKPHSGVFGSGRFCGRACANTRKHSTATKEKIRISILTSPKAKKALKNLNSCRTITKIKKQCPVCDSSFEVYKESQIYCTRGCYKEDSKCKFRFTPIGGLRKGAGRGRGGWYKGYYCDSTYELAWVYCQLKKQKDFKRNRKGFPYFFEGKWRKYYPDFYLPAEKKYIEIKGFFSDKTNAKIAYFPHPLIILDKKGMQPFLQEARANYGKNFAEAMYESKEKIDPDRI